MARIWGGIILGSRTDLHVQSVAMTGHIYRVIVLEQHVRLFRNAMGAEFLLIDDNTRPHRANIVDECLQSDIWILTDSYASIQHLSHWTTAGDVTSLNILHVVVRLLIDTLFTFNGSPPTLD
ncbi:transposable element Tcb2 transposase [Trichonephila clavipes]|nr:transposable element Tcb2 transposase [Trichonephila clavipes]